MDTEKIKEEINGEIESYIKKKDKTAYLLNDFLSELKKMNENKIPLKEQVEIMNKFFDSKISKHKLAEFLVKNKIRKIIKRTAVKKGNGNEKDKK
jgi:hypothetical protein